MRRIVCSCVALLALGAATARAQRPSFDVVSIKLGDPNERRRGIGTRGNQLEVVNTPLKDMIGFAYDVETDQIFRGPKWIDSDLFTITARPNGATALPQRAFGVHRDRRATRTQTRIRARAGRDSRRRQRPKTPSGLG